MDEFRSVQVLDPTLVPDGTTADDFTDSNRTLSVARFAATGNEAKLNLYRKSHSTDVTFDNDHEKSSEELLKDLHARKYYGALKLLQNSCLFEKEQVAFHLRSNLDNFSVLY